MTSGYKAIETEVTLQLSWWDCFKGILRPWRMKSRKVTAVVAIADEHGEAMDIDNCPWIPSVHVLSKEIDKDGRFVEKIAKCMIDTGNLQGNLISKNFLLQHLGYCESDFAKLKDSDRAGSSVSGHPVIPDGAVKLTWYHPGSVRIYRDMRFLVLENATYDLVLCAQAIEKHKIVNAPNFGDVVTSKKVNTDDEEQRLRAAKEKAENNVLTLERELKDAKSANDDVKTQRIQRKIKPAQDESKKAKEDYNKYVQEKAQEEAAKAKKSETKPQPTPQIIVTDVKGARRATTFLRTSTSRALGKK